MATACLLAIDSLYSYVSRRAVVSHEAKKKQHARAFQAYATTTVSYLHGWSVLIFKILLLSHYYSYRLDYYRPGTSCWVELITEQSIKSAQPFLRTSQSVSFDAHFRDDSQKSSYACNNA